MAGIDGIGEFPGNGAKGSDIPPQRFEPLTALAKLSEAPSSPSASRFAVGAATGQRLGSAGSSIFFAGQQAQGYFRSLDAAVRHARLLGTAGNLGTTQNVGGAVVLKLADDQYAVYLVRTEVDPETAAAERTVAGRPVGVNGSFVLADIAGNSGTTHVRFDHPQAQALVTQDGYSVLRQGDTGRLDPLSYPIGSIDTDGSSPDPLSRAIAALAGLSDENLGGMFPLVMRDVALGEIADIERVAQQSLRQFADRGALNAEIEHLQELNRLITEAEEAVVQARSEASAEALQQREADLAALRALRRHRFPVLEQVGNLDALRDMESAAERDRVLNEAASRVFQASARERSDIASGRLNLWTTDLPFVIAANLPDQQRRLVEERTARERRAAAASAAGRAVVELAGSYIAGTTLLRTLRLMSAGGPVSLGQLPPVSRMLSPGKAGITLRDPHLLSRLLDRIRLAQLRRLPPTPNTPDHLLRLPLERMLEVEERVSLELDRAERFFRRSRPLGRGS
jgi:hypothetical protein